MNRDGASGAVPLVMSSLIMRLVRSFSFFSSLLLAATALAVYQNVLQVSETEFCFEIFDPAEPVVHAFNFHNSGSNTIQVAAIAVTEPLRVNKVLSKILPG